MSSYAGRVVTEAVLAALTAAGLNAGDGEQPSNSGWVSVPGQSNFRGYVVVHPVGSAQVDGSIDHPSEDVWPVHQVTAYGANRAQCEQIADTARGVMLDTQMAVTGHGPATWLIDLVGVVTRVDDVQPHIYMAPDRYTSYITAS